MKISFGDIMFKTLLTYFIILGFFCLFVFEREGRGES